jgi:diaminopimelate epimerase
MRAIMHFTKMNGAGNDFVVLDNRAGALSLDRAAVARICDRHRGIGADGLLVVEPAQNGGDFRMRYYNSDGGEAEMCGNGARCFARFAGRLNAHGGGDKKARIRFETMAGVISAELLGEDVRLSMSAPHSTQLNKQLDLAGETHTIHSINTGVPHAVVFVKDLDALDLAKVGAALRFHPHFAPKGTNANFAAEQDPQTIAVRTYERGVENETLACGTGVVASALVFHELTGASSPIRVKVKGGELLEVGFKTQPGGFSDVTLTGPAEFVFEGEIAL